MKKVAAYTAFIVILPENLLYMELTRRQAEKILKKGDAK